MSQIIDEAFYPFYNSFKNLAAVEKRPHLAHYTSIDSLERIVASGEIWFSNPLFMNDLQELRFGLLEGRALFQKHFGDPEFLSEFASPDSAKIIEESFHGHFNAFDEKAIDLFVFCLSEHDVENRDGLLSMWRGYGGYGNGAAVVFDTTFITANEASPLFIGQVIYATDDARRAWISSMLQVAKSLALHGALDDVGLKLLAFNIFYVMKFYALMTKHHGFSEEREWRIIYFPERDTDNFLTSKSSYHVSSKGVEPKLKFPIQPLPFERPTSWTFESIVDHIILGPSLSSGASAGAVRRMLKTLGKPTMAEKVIASGIPLRPR